MQENKTSQQVAGNLNGHQNETTLVKQDNPKKENNESQKNPAPSNTEEIPAPRKELKDTDHQHDYKTPGENQNADKNSSDDKFQNLSPEADHHETVERGTGKESKG